MIGDIVGELGIKKVKEVISEIKKTQIIDFVIANGENSADGMGLNAKLFAGIIEAGVDVVTMGNHTWGKKGVFDIIEHEKILRPINYPNTVPGRGYGIYEVKGKKIAVVNVLGRVDMHVLCENPFLQMDELLEKLKNKADIIIVDFHAEATAEKIGMAFYLDGRVTCLFGTHTHIQTADEEIWENGMAYITDVRNDGAEEVCDWDGCRGFD